MISHSANSPSDPLFQGPGEMQALSRAFDWSATRLGPIARWSQPLRTAAQLVLASPFPMTLLWGPDLIQLYNDGYRALMGNKHPAGLGQPTQACWPEVWHINEPLYRRVWAGESFAFEDALYPITRSGQLQDAWFTLAYSPVLDEAAQVAGVLVTVFETTGRIVEQRHRQAAQLALSEREKQQTFLLTLSDALRPLSDPVAVQQTAMRVLGEHLQVNRAFYGELLENDNTLLIGPGYTNQLPALDGSVSFAAFDSDLIRYYQAGQTVVIHDLHRDMELSAQGRAAFDAIQMRAMVGVPLVKDKNVRAILSIHQSVPRQWTAEEVTLLEETAERTWAAVERAKAEKALRESQERLQLALDASGMGAFLWYPQEDRTEADARAFTLLGLGQNDTITLAQSLAVSIHPDDREFYAAAVASAVDVNGDGKLDLDYRVVRPDGSLHWLHIYGQTFFSGENPTRATLMYGLFDDITERKRREANLAFLADISRELVQLTTISETMNALGARIGGHFGASRCGFFEFNEAMDEAVCEYDWRRADLPNLAGSYRTADFYTDEFLQTMRAREAFVLRDRDTDSRVDAESLAALHIASLIVIPIVTDKQSLFVLSINDTVPRNWHDDEIDLMRELTTRIWTRVVSSRAEEALRESEEKFRLLGIASSDSIYTMNPDWTQMHQLIEKTFLADKTDPNSSWLDVYIPPENQPQVQPVLQAAIRTKSTVELEHRVRQADGTVGWTFFRAIPLLDEQGNIREWVGAASDITARKQAEEALLISDRRKSEFLAMLAHELRNPLSTLHNTLLLLGITRGQDETLPLDRAQAMMSREVTHLNRMVDDLLDVSRISQGKIHLRKERLDLGKLVREALEAARAQFAGRQQTLTIHVPAAPLWVDGDRTRLTQVVRNLATNAAKYTPAGGRIGVTLETERGQAVLRIRDNGIGIAADQLQAIFEVFVQVSASLDRPQGGLGLGLAVVKQLVELHGGRIDVYSPGLGQGSEFTVQVPSLLDGPPQPVSKGEGDGHTVTARRILVVDDSADLALTTAMLLRHEQYEAHTCLSGSDALVAVESLQPAAILLDLGMPDMDGFDTCRRLRALDWGRQGIIVALSGYGQEDDKKRTRESGFDGHLVKPLNLQALTDLLNKLLKTTNRAGN